MGSGGRRSETDQGARRHVAVVRDVEAELAEARDELREALRQIDDTEIPMMFVDRALRIRRFTPATTQLMRLVPSDVGRALDEVKERVDDGTLVPDVEKVIAGPVPVVTEVQSDDGRWFTRKILPCRAEDGRVDGACIIYHETTAQRDAVAKTDEAREYAEAVVDTVQTPVLILDSDLCVVSANQCFSSTFGLDAAATVGERLYDLEGSRWDTPSLHALLDRIVETKGAVRDYRIEQQTPAHRVLIANARWMRRRRGDEVILLNVADVTQLAEAARVLEEHAAELSEEGRRKDEFLAMLGHELRNPLAAIVHGIEALDFSDGEPAQHEEIRAMMSRQARRMTDQLDQLLDVARVTAGKIGIAREPVDLNDAVRAAIETMRPNIDQHRHRVELQLSAPGRAVVLGDAMRLAQVVENLLSNAAKYTPDGGVITVSVARERDAALVRVADTGVGLEPDLAAHVFDVFTQAPRTLERAAGGLGLGLPLVKRIAELHGGTVSVTSEGVGHGSEFVLRLPVLSEAPAKRKERAKRAVPEGGPRRVLVVDDQEDAALMLSDILRRRGHESMAVFDGPSALEAAATFRPHVVLLDLGLPGMDGYEVAAKLRETHGARLRIAALTGYKRDDQRLAQAGFDHHVLKPPDLRELLAWIARAPDGRGTVAAHPGGR